MTESVVKSHVAAATQGEEVVNRAGGIARVHSHGLPVVMMHDQIVFRATVLAGVVILGEARFSEAVKAPAGLLRRCSRDRLRATLRRGVVKRLHSAQVRIPVSPVVRSVGSSLPVEGALRTEPLPRRRLAARANLLARLRPGPLSGARPSARYRAPELRNEGLLTDGAGSRLGHVRNVERRGRGRYTMTSQ